jgi:hypothetical protein
MRRAERALHHLQRAAACKCAYAVTLTGCLLAAALSSAWSDDSIGTAGMHEGPSPWNARTGSGPRCVQSPTASPRTTAAPHCACAGSRLPCGAAGEPLGQMISAEEMP